VRKVKNGRCTYRPRAKKLAARRGDGYEMSDSPPESADVPLSPHTNAELIDDGDVQQIIYWDTLGYESLVRMIDGRYMLRSAFYCDVGNDAAAQWLKQKVLDYQTN